jgi:hypothetical protein
MAKKRDLQFARHVKEQFCSRDIDASHALRNVLLCRTVKNGVTSLHRSSQIFARGDVPTVHCHLPMRRVITAARNDPHRLPDRNQLANERSAEKSGASGDKDIESI